MTHMSKNWEFVINKILEESGSRNGNQAGLTGKEVYELTMKFDKKYVLLLKDDIHSFVFSDGVTPPEGILNTRAEDDGRQRAEDLPPSMREDHLENIDDDGVPYNL